MIASYPERRFQLWEYRVSHGSLLIRSPKSRTSVRNVDLIFVGVEYLAVPDVLAGVTLERGGDTDVARVRAAIGDAELSHVFVVVSGGRRHTIVAAACRVVENDSDIFDSPISGAS